MGPKGCGPLVAARSCLIRIGGADADRTRGLQSAILALSQLSYGPTTGRGVYHGTPVG